MANTAGVKVTSAEALPAEQAGAYRRIGLRVNLDAGWSALVALLRAVQQATPRMFVDDVQLHAQPTGEKVRELPLDIALTVLAFRMPGAAPARPARDADARARRGKPLRMGLLLAGGVAAVFACVVGAAACPGARRRRGRHRRRGGRRG